MFKELSITSGTITYQTEFIDVGVLAYMVDQVPVGHPRVNKREWRIIGAKAKETNHVWVL